MKTRSKESFKKLVKRQAKKVALANLKKKQAAHSKMRNLEYSKLELQSYFKFPGIKVDMQRNLFKFRTRMAPFGENFRGNQEVITCPLCNNDKDNQAHSFNCQAIKDKMEIKCDISDVYSDTITLDTAETVTEILEVRKNIIESMNMNQDLMDGN